MKQFLALLVTLASTYSMQAPVMEAVMQATDEGMQAPLMDTAHKIEERAYTVCFKSKISPADKAVIVQKHKKYRKESGVHPIDWTRGPSGVAEYYLEKCTCSKCGKTSQQVVKKTCGPKDEYPSTYGLNVGIGSSVGAILNEWHSGKKLYGPRIGQCKQKGACNLYIQMVFDILEQYGCATKKCGGKVVLACAYSNDGPTDGKDLTGYPEPK